MRIASAVITILLCAPLWGSALGCGPIVGGVQIINADIALSAAKTAGAQRTAIGITGNIGIVDPALFQHMTLDVAMVNGAWYVVDWPGTSDG